MSTELMSLWKIEEELTALLDTIDATPPELQPEIEAAITEYLERSAEKVDSIAHVLSALDWEQKAAADEISRLQERKKAAKASQERLEKYVCRVIAMRGAKLAGKTNTLSVRPSEAVEVTDEKAVPILYQRIAVKMPRILWVLILRGANDEALRQLNTCPAFEEKIEVPLDPIKRALKAGDIVPGAELEKRSNLQRT
jgi:predicted nuclease with TOPRIM domain